MRKRPNRPAAFSPDDPNVIVAEAESDIDDISIPTADETAAGLPAQLPAPSRRPSGFRWGTIFWSALGGLGSLAVGLSVAHLIEELFARSAALGWAGSVLAAAAGLAFVVVVAREIRGLMKLSAIESLREQALAAIASDRRSDSIAVVEQLLSLTRSTPTLASARKTVASHLDDIIDGADMIYLAERHLMRPLDDEAKRLISNAAKRVSIVTAISPRALIDMLFVLGSTVNLVRRLAYLYGARPGALGMIRLVRLCIAHLTVTGGMALGDGIVQQVLGHGVVAKLSSRLGEGVLNGLLTARLGLAAVEVIRPLPFAALPRPALGDVAAELVRQHPPDS